MNTKTSDHFAAPRRHYSEHMTSATSTHSQTDVVVEGIKAMITSGCLEPGARLPVEKDLAADLGVSRGSLREGVRALALMGVVETRQGDGTYVTSLDPQLLLAPLEFMVDLQATATAAHMQAVRRVLETEAVGLAAHRIGDPALDEAQALLGSLQAHLDDGTAERDEAMQVDIAFHHLIAEESGNPALQALIDAMASRTIRARTWRAIEQAGALAAAHAEHVAILNELREHDSDRARIRMSTHLLGVEEFLDARGHDER